MNYTELISIEKKHFSNIHSEFDKFTKLIKLLKHNNCLSSETLEKIIILNKHMQEITTNLMDINNDIKNTNTKKNKKNNKNMIDGYEKNEKAINAFLPYILYYRFLID